MKSLEIIQTQIAILSVQLDTQEPNENNIEKQLEDLRIVEEDLKKLKEKETPKKPIERLFEQKKHFKICPSCWEKGIKTFVYGNYCDECGQRLN